MVDRSSVEIARKNTVASPVGQSAVQGQCGTAVARRKAPGRSQSPGVTAYGPDLFAKNGRGPGTELPATMSPAGRGQAAVRRAFSGITATQHGISGAVDASKASRAAAPRGASSWPSSSRVRAVVSLETGVQGKCLRIDHGVEFHLHDLLDARLACVHMIRHNRSASILETAKTSVDRGAGRRGRGDKFR